MNGYDLRRARLLLALDWQIRSWHVVVRRSLLDLPQHEAIGKLRSLEAAGLCRYYGPNAHADIVPGWSLTTAGEAAQRLIRALSGSD